MQTLKPPLFTQPGDSAGQAEITRLEAFWLACIREQDVDMLRTLVNSLTGVGGLKLVWSDPLFDDTEADE